MFITKKKFNEAILEAKKEVQEEMWERERYERMERCFYERMDRLEKRLFVLENSGNQLEPVKCEAATASPSGFRY